MFKIFAVTNRHLCREPLPERIRKLSEAGADAVILREKDLPESQYLDLAREALAVCGGCILHSFPGAAQQLGAKALHLPLPVLRSLSRQELRPFEILGASCHSLRDVQEAQSLGCTYVTLGHIFATDCKKGLPPRGLELLAQVCRESRIPVCAIGGIRRENLASVEAAGAAGACMMSGLMTCPDPAAQLALLRRALENKE